MESLKLILILLVTVVILALYTMNTAIWPYHKGFQSFESPEKNIDEKQPCQLISEQYEFIGRAFRHEIMEFFLFVNNSYIHNITTHKNIYKMIVKRLLEITNGFSNPQISKFAKQPDKENNLTMRGINASKEFRCL